MNLTRHLYFWVLLAILIGGTIGYVSPETGVALKPLGDGFIALVKMLIAPIIFCTVVLGIAGAGQHEEGRARRRQGAAVLRSGLDLRAGDRPDRRQCDPARRRIQRRSRVARRRGGGRLREGRRQPEHRRFRAAHHPAHVLRRLHRLRRPAAGAVRRGAVRLRDDAPRAGRQHRPPGDHDGVARVLPDDERADDAGADRRRRRDGVHHRPLRRRGAEAAGAADGQLLPDVPAVRVRGARHRSRRSPASASSASSPTSRRSC